MLPEIGEEIKKYNEKIKAGDYERPAEQCPSCKKNPGEFKLHDQRKRKVRIIVNALVEIVVTILVRWKCPLCKKKFTAYPAFIIAHRRYATPYVTRLSENYLQKEKVSYENATKDGHLKIGYLGRDESLLAGSTIWRWVGWLGSLKESLNKALDMIRQKYPQTDIFRRMSVPCFPGKYKSEGRKEILERAMKVLAASKEYEKIFAEKFFPRFAIKQE